jgi:hypothetical protein
MSWRGQPCARVINADYRLAGIRAISCIGGHVKTGWPTATACSNKEGSASLLIESVLMGHI